MPTAPIRVLQLISSCDFLGAERVVAEMARQSDPAQCRMSIGVIAPDSQVPERLREEIGREDIEVVQLPGVGRFNRECSRQIGELIASRGIQILHSHNYKSDFYAWVTRYVGGRQVALVASSHTWKLTATIEWVYKFLDLKLLTGFAGIAAISDSIRDEILRAGAAPHRVRVIDNGINTGAFGQISRSEARRRIACPEDAWVIGCVASLTPEKGHPDLLAALATAAPGIPNCRLLLIGEGPERPHIEQLLEQLNLAGKVDLLGARKDVHSLYPAFDGFALASHDEGLPMVVLEAMASGVPVVATAVGALPRVLGEEHGLLVPPRAPADLAGALIALYRDPARAQAMREKGRARVEQTFSSRRMAREYEELYRTVVAGAAH